MMSSRIMKREVKPLAENYAVVQDKFLSSLVASVFLEGSKNTMIPALTASASVYRAQPSVRNSALKLKNNLIDQCHNEPQRKRINEFTERILQNTNSSKSLSFGMLPATVEGSFKHFSLEDFCPKNGEYSNFLKSLIEELESILPPLRVIKEYKDHFYENVFPNLPFLNVASFENSLSHTLFEDENDSSRVKIRLGSSRLRNKVENICLLLVILKLSHISLSFIEEGSLNDDFQSGENLIQKYPIGNGYIVMVENCLLAENMYSCANENILTCLLYIWSFFVYSPEEGDFFLEHPTDVLGGLIVMLATSIGLHRDPSEYPQLEAIAKAEPGIFNHRRILWLAVITTVSFESCLKGRYPLSLEESMNHFVDMRHPNALGEYLERIKKDMESPDPSFLKHFENGFKRAILGLLISDLDRMTLTYKGSFSLAAFESLRNRIEDYVKDNYFPTKLKFDPDEYSNTEQTRNRIADANNLRAFVSQHSLIMSKLILLRSSMALFYHFEARLPKEPHLIKYYREYFLKICVESVALAKYIVQFFGGGYSDTSLPSKSYNITKATQMALSSNFFGLLGMIMRIELAGNMLFLEYHNNSAENSNEKLHEHGQKMEFLSALKKELEIGLEEIYNLASKHLRFTYFSVFKMLALFDVIIQRMRKGELWSGILFLQHVKEINSSSVKSLGLTLSIDLQNDVNIVDQLKMKNFLGDFSLKYLNEIYQKVRSTNQTDPLVHTDNVETTEENLNYGPSSAVPNSSSLGNLDKLTSAATMSHHFDVHSNMSEQKRNFTTKYYSEYGTEKNSGQGSGTRQESEMGMPIEFSGIFGGLDLFDYDFLFSNEL